VNDRRARELVASERTRIEAALRELIGDVRAEGMLERQQTGESDSGSELATEMVEVAMVAGLRAELAAVVRAEERIAAGAFGRSVDSGRVIPDERLESEPLAERTIEEQRRYDEGAR
jgi:DnaK suppressor protein